MALLKDGCRGLATRFGHEVQFCASTTGEPSHLPSLRARARIWFPYVLHLSPVRDVNSDTTFRILPMNTDAEGGDELAPSPTPVVHYEISLVHDAILVSPSCLPKE